MKILCLIFGHIPNPGYAQNNHAGYGYFKVALDAVDDMGTIHAKLMTTCQRCHNTYQIGLIRVPEGAQLEPFSSLRSRSK